MGMIPGVHFGVVGKGIDWRNGGDVPDPDDEELEKTPEDVIRMLGFDPIEKDE